MTKKLTQIIGTHQKPVMPRAYFAVSEGGGVAEEVIVVRVYKDQIGYRKCVDVKTKMSLF